MLSLVFGLICRFLVRACRCAGIGYFIPLRIFLPSRNIFIPCSGIGGRFGSSDLVANSHASKHIGPHAVKCAVEILSASNLRMVSPSLPPADYAVSETAVGTASAHFRLMIARSAESQRLMEAF